LFNIDRMYVSFSFFRALVSAQTMRESVGQMVMSSSSSES